MDIPWRCVRSDAGAPRRYRWGYWTCFAASLAALPYAKEFDASGHVALLGKAADAAKRMALMWVAMGVAGCVALALVAASGRDTGSDALEAAALAASNTVNALVLVVLLGVGCVELPKAFWVAGSLDKALERSYFRRADNCPRTSSRGDAAARGRG